jgi:hypothetical protein
MAKQVNSKSANKISNRGYESTAAKTEGGFAMRSASRHTWWGSSELLV